MGRMMVGMIVLIPSLYIVTSDPMICPFDARSYLSDVRSYSSDVRTCSSVARHVCLM